MIIVKTLSRYFVFSFGFLTEVLSCTYPSSQDKTTLSHISTKEFTTREVKTTRRKTDYRLYKI